MKIAGQILIVLVLFPIAGCTEAPPAQSQPTQVEQYLTPEQVISIVQVYGVPYVRQYSSGALPYQAHPVGPWAAVYENDDNWRIQGTVIVTCQGEEHYLSSTWIYKDNELSLHYIQKPTPKPVTSERLPTRRPIKGEWKE